VTVDNVFYGILTGNDAFVGEDVQLKAAIAERFKAIKHSIPQKSGDYLYSGNRCEPENLGWRLLQNFYRFPVVKDLPSVEDIFYGRIDEEIISTYHEAASCEWYYTYEKDWG
jgi:hypothetical protein